jgi:RNA recognition motif-containing protein
LNRETGKSDIMNNFSKFGNITNINLKDHFAFVDFDDHEAATQAIKEMNGKTFIHGEVLKVE